ncbi:mRNA export factor MEX67 [Spathaspora sp. JA1]|nr:mRNA export factor MEX67 [Spathaspora sp. JA1]
MSYRGRGRGGGFHGGYNNNQNHQQNSQYNQHHQQQNVDAFVAANSIPIEIMGWNGASSGECINFISRKCRVVVSNYSVDENTGVLKGYVKSEAQVKQLTDYNGVRFAGQALRFSKGSGTLSNQIGGGAGGAMNTIETITHFLKLRYQPEIKLLNLSNVKQDPTLAAQGFFGSISTTSKFFPALMKIANDLKLDVVSIDLSNNELNDLQTVSTMATTFPKLQNLSLHNNNFQRIRVFESWKHKLNFLRELILTENPIMNNNPQELQSIKLELMRSFPRLVVLNGEVLRNESVLNINLTFPFESTQPMFFQDDNIRNLATNFIANYFKLWDSNRADLMILYQNESQFSIQVDSAHPHLIENNQSHDLGYYIPNSRNLTRVSSSKARQSKLSTGQEQIFKSFTQLPKTHHDLLNKPEMYSMESFTYVPLNGIMIIIHGSFEETAAPDNLDSVNNTTTASGTRGRYGQQQSKYNKKIPLSKKSFDRTFLVIPGPNGSMIVASDILTIRPFTSTPAWISTTAPVAGAAVNTPAGAPAPNSTTATPGHSQSPQPIVNAITSVEQLPVEIKNSLNPVQQELLIKILIETKLNIQYGIMLCEQSNWDYNLCSINFKNSAPTLPREAFV